MFARMCFVRFSTFSYARTQLLFWTDAYWVTSRAFLEAENPPDRSWYRSYQSYAEIWQLLFIYYCYYYCIIFYFLLRPVTPHRSPQVNKDSLGESGSAHTAYQPAFLRTPGIRSPHPSLLGVATQRSRNVTVAEARGRLPPGLGVWPSLLSQYSAQLHSLLFVPLTVIFSFSLATLVFKISTAEAMR